jgi:hypothetical protein
MSEFRKIPPYLINSAKPDKGDFPMGMELLNRGFFEKLEHDLLPDGKPILEELLRSPKQRLPEAIAKLLPFIKNDKLKVALVSQLLGDRDEYVKWGAAQIISGHSEAPKHHRLYSTIPRKNLNVEKGKEDSIPVVKFPKTGSDMYLLPNEYVGKEIVRVVNKEALECWQKALAAEDEWQEAGFDYIPIEPILHSKNGRLRISPLEDSKDMCVFAEVLGPNLKAYFRNKRNRAYAPELVERGNKILEVLNKKLHIQHGHAHPYNFCIKFENKKPQVYLIDFDEAKHNINAQD